jgi:hypothetical protein
MKALFPDHDDVRKYDTKSGGQKKYCIDWAKAIASEVNNGEYRIFAGNAMKYDLQRLYGMNKQPIEKYMKLLNISDQQDRSFMNADLTPTGPLPKYIKMAVEKVLIAEYGPVCTPIDMLSRDENNKKIAEIKSKLMMREMMAKVDPESAQSPVLQPAPGEPQDIQELQMRNGFPDQFNRAMDAELVISAVLHETNTWVQRPDWVKDLVYHGVAMFKDYLDDNKRPAWRKVNLRNFVSSKSESERFEDLRFAGEFFKVTLATLSNYFNTEEMQVVKSQANSPNPFNKIGMQYPAYQSQNIEDRDRGEALVFDFEFMTHDTLNVEEGVSKYGNPQVKKYWGKAGKKSENKISKQVDMVYGGKWVVGTDLIYDFGPIKNMARNYATPEKMIKTKLNYWGVADDIHNMIVASYIDRLIPLADDYILARVNIQNVRNEMVPNGWAINEDALEDSDLVFNGVGMDKEAKIRLFIKRGILVYRGSQISGQSNGNAKPIEFMQNQSFGEFLRLYDQLQLIKQEMRDVLGLNEVTDGSTPSDRMLNGVASMAEQSTNTALRPLMRCDKYIIETLSKRMLIRVQQTVRAKGKYFGYAPGVNGTSLQFVEMDNKITERDYDIMIEARPNDEQKQLLISQMQSSIEQGFIDPTEIFTILTTYNLKQAQQMLAYKVEKRREQKQQEAMQMQKVNGEEQRMSNMQAEEEKRKTMQVEFGFKMQLEQEITRRLLAVKQMDVDSRERIKGLEVDGKLTDTTLKQEAESGAMMPEMMEDAA